MLRLNNSKRIFLAVCILVGVFAGAFYAFASSDASMQDEISMSEEEYGTKGGSGNVTEKTDVKITEFTITEESGETPTSITTGHRYDLSIGWDAGAYGNTLLSGDYFVTSLPDEMQFPTNHSATHFNINAEDGSVLAAAVVNSNGSAGGGNIVVTFTDYVENKYNITGRMSLSFTLIKEKILTGQTNTFRFSVASEIYTLDIGISEPGPGELLDPEEVLFKRASKSSSTDEYAQWTARINFARYTLPNATLSDEVRSTDPDFVSRYIPDSFELQERVFDEYGNNTATVNSWSAEQLGERLQFYNDCTGFTLNMENISGKQFYLKYRTTYSPGIVLNNRMSLTSNQDIWSDEFEYQDATSGGEGGGILNSRIKIVKKEMNTGTALADAIFEITDKNTGETFRLTTDENGEAVSDKLIAGEYIIREITAPPGYLLDEAEYSTTVSEDQPSEVEIFNVPVISTPITGEEETDDTIPIPRDPVSGDKPAIQRKPDNGFTVPRTRTETKTLTAPSSHSVPPKTGDDAVAWPWFIAMLLSVLGAIRSVLGVGRK